MRYILLLTVLLAFNAFAAPDFDETMAAANQGDAYAQYNLGVMYANGDGVPENDAEAVKWYRKAADQGYAVAQYNLGLCMTMAKVFQRTMLRQLSGTGKQLIKGYAQAQFNLGVMYDKGEWCSRERC